MQGKWTVEHDEYLRQCIALSVDWSEVAHRMQAKRPGINLDACRMRAKRKGWIFGTAPRRWTPDQDAALARWASALGTWDEVATQIERSRPGVTVEAVKQRAKKLGLTSKSRAWTEPARAIVETEIEAGTPYREIADMLQALRPGITAEAVRQQALALGLR